MQIYRYADRVDLVLMIVGSLAGSLPFVLPLPGIVFDFFLAILTGGKCVFS